ncbi:DALR anticodon-binding domain-containing protein [Planomonospora venezuelensis]|uniref:Arginyl-tRNA synthetase n=1 Tax=Planomonospora venezuelensis TaxID=1999 RepID=A0A841DDY4_PLAVE|nr:DALR anticodon-binding domain-containing protein [Planomonospora venezuelensis]MBB5965496.1 arginyl-tRNA synthetase [Planomonospora venezuelensis]
MGGDGGGDGGGGGQAPPAGRRGTPGWLGTPGRLGEVLGAPPAPQGTWETEACYVSPAALRRGEPPQELAGRLRALPGVAAVRVRANGFLEIVVAVPGELVEEIGPHRGAGAAARDGRAPWADSPLTWDNPGFVVGYAHARAVAVQRWAAELGVAGEFRPELLDGGRDRAVLRLLAELEGRRASRDPGWAAYAEQLALAYHDAFERAPALPAGDEEPSALHVARVRLARAVRDVLAEATAAVGVVVPDRL